jgi:hypothetical protein
MLAPDARRSLAAVNVAMKCAERQRRTSCGACAYRDDPRFSLPCRPGERRDPNRGIYRYAGVVDDLRNNDTLGLWIPDRARDLTALRAARSGTTPNLIFRFACQIARKTSFRIPAARSARVVRRSPSKNGGRRECRVFDCTRSLVCEVIKHTSTVTTGEAETSTFPARWC